MLSTGEILSALRKQLAHAAYAGVREPIVDPACPATSDIDVLVFDEADGLLPERRHLDINAFAPPSLDLLRMPQAALLNLTALASYGLITHRLLNSRPVVVRDSASDILEHVRALAYRPESQIPRLRGFLEMGSYTVREIGITRDFPELAILWCAIAQIACAAALIDVSGEFCPNIYTRPLDHMRQLEQRSGIPIVDGFVRAAHLDGDFGAAAAELERMHAIITERFLEPAWPSEMRSATRAEYRYFAAKDELVLRVRAAREMLARGDQASALFYLRFHSYMLARIPMVHRCAREGRNVSFVRPERAVRRILAEECPEILEPLRYMLGGGRTFGVADVQASLSETLRLYRRTLGELKRYGYDLDPLPPWEPYQPVPRTVSG